MKGHVCALVGAQFGSEGKGAITYEVAGDYSVHVRTGAPNAGHTIWHHGQCWKMQSLPCGWVNPNAALVIGAGALVNVDLLFREVWTLEDAGYSIRDRLYIDEKAGILSTYHHEFEGGVGGDAHRLIGSTGEGVGPARMAKLARGTWAFHPLDVFEQAKDNRILRDEGFTVWDTVDLLDGYRQCGESILLEGTQGCGLSLVHGLWPYVTTADTNAASLCADAGLPPAAVERVILVARTFPIRVAGNSGPLENEVTWEEVGVEPEITTVTKKVRRVGMWDGWQVGRAVKINGATEIALTFLDYIYPEVKGMDSADDLPEYAFDWPQMIEEQWGVPVTFLGTGPDSVIRVPKQASVAC